MRILYLHGLASSKESRTAKALAEQLLDDEVLAIDIPMGPYDAVSAIFKAICSFHPDMIVGTSLGGFYAMLFEGPWKVLINPAMRPDEEIANVLGSYGEHKYLKKREDGAETFVYTKEHEEEFKEIREHFEDAINDFDNISETYAIFGCNDMVVNDRGHFNKHFEPRHATTFIGEHRLSEGNIKHILIPLIKDIKGK